MIPLLCNDVLAYRAREVTALDIVWLDHEWSRDVTKVGGKGASLGRLADGYTVPPAFSLTVDAFDRWGEARRNGNGPSSDMLSAVTHAYAKLGVLCGTDEPAVAVRSSAVDEDGSDNSFAGQHDTFLNVKGGDAVAQAVVRCWASLDGAVALDYRKQSGLEIDEAVMAVVVQQMVPSDISGVAFSANPVNGELGQVVINSSWGLGESVVSGTVTPDTYTIDKAAGTVMSSQISNKARMTISKGDGAEEVDVPRIMREQPSMSDEQTLEVARLAESLEKREGHPVDIEWAIFKDTLYLLQCRPITTLG
jgi:phosphoenolpyruvate synthase/pyruvate phosphate dikinase